MPASSEKGGGKEEKNVSRTTAVALKIKTAFLAVLGKFSNVAFILVRLLVLHTEHYFQRYEYEHDVQAKGECATTKGSFCR